MSDLEFLKIIANINNSFSVSRERIGARNSLWKLLPVKLAGISKKFDKGEPISGIELQEIRSKWRSEDPLIDEHGTPFVFYIHDFSKSHWGEPKRVFHVAWCSTLEMMKNEGREKRYIKKTDLDNNNFKVDYGHGRKEVKQLPACYNCRDKMQNKIIPNELYYDRNNLDIVKFFKMYGRQDLIDMNNPMYSVNYPENWSKISLKLREEAKWICNNCGRDYTNNRGNLHVHHIDGRLDNIDPRNLQVLCVDCHSKQFGHNTIRNTINPRRYRTRYKTTISDGTISISQINKLKNFIKQPEKYAIGTGRSIQNVKDIRHSFGLVKHKLSREKQEEFSKAMRLYESKLKK